ncbi:hypothetical protein L7F22_014708 [Adiantum nelumboides]|nr:hypothetical protein [Adiantum nelumboides]
MAVACAAMASPAIVTQANVPLEWPEPIQRVQLLAESGVSELPTQYVRPESERVDDIEFIDELEIPLIDISGLDDDKRRKLVLAEIGHACEECGFFQVTNHGIPLSLLQRTLLVAKQFFDLPLDEKQAYANNPLTYEGYGSRLGVEKGAILDWGDYFFFHVLPTSIRDPSKWPTRPTLWRETMDEYSQHLAKLGYKMLEAISTTLDVSPNTLKESFGDHINLALRVNFYPSCPQPNLTLGLSAHSDPGGLTILLQDEQVSGLQVRRHGKWVPVKPTPGGLIVNLGDQIQIMSNGIYKSVEHRAVVNRDKQRVSIAAFFNPSNEQEVGPIRELVSPKHPARYMPMTFKEYRSFIRRSGTQGKQFVDSVTSSPIETPRQCSSLCPPPPPPLALSP